jgi:ABC-type uncharacterized transport system ATPase subunit
LRTYFSYFQLKGSDNIDREVEDLLVKLDLDEKASSMACTLSGGMKRKLCLGMALIGDSKVSVMNEFLEVSVVAIYNRLYWYICFVMKFVKAFYFYFC